ncbi:MAG: sigma-70 family RNA polymerase sigma factor [Gemmataceae bacterium]
MAGPETRPSLLARVRDVRDRDAWREFIDLYGPLVYRYGRRQGLQDADAADLTQCVMQALAGRLDYDEGRGAFRAWLFGVARRQLLKQIERNRRQPRGVGDTTNLLHLEEHPAPEETAWWDEEYKRRRFLWAVEKVRPHFAEASWQAFWRTAVDGADAKEVSRELGLSIGAVYTAKSRALDRIRKEIAALEE